MKKTMRLTLLLLLCIGSMYASGQDKKTVSGTVQDSLGNNLSGVSISVKGTKTSTLSDASGNFKISASLGQVLVFSFVGYEKNEVNVGEQSVFSIALKSASEKLADVVVVTAMGIKKQARSLGYAVSTVTAKELTQSGNTNFASALYGKAAGVKITTAPGGATSAVNVQIRGVSSINGNTQPLYVVDGVPVRLYNDLQGNAGSNANNGGYWANQRIQGNGVLDINPEDIESLTILKGASASALYGSEATNGVVVITTKKGTKGAKGLGVDFNYNITKENLAFSPDYQNEYGPGYDKLTNISLGGTYTPVDEAALGWIKDQDGTYHPRYRNYAQFGPKFDGRMVKYWDGTMRPYAAQPDNYKDFFQTGYSSNANIAISNAGDKGSYRFSYTRTDYTGIQRGGKLGKNYFSFNSTLKLNDRISLDVVSSYSNGLTHNRPTLMSRLFAAYDGFFSRMDDMNTILTKYQTTKGYKWVPYNGEYDLDERLAYNYRATELLDYLWGRLKNSYDENQNRFINSVTLNVGILKNLKFRGRIGGDFTSTNYETKNYNEHASIPGSNLYTPSGSYQISKTIYNIFYGDVLLTYNGKINKDVDFTLTGGITSRSQKYSENGIYTDGGLVKENWFSMNNSQNALKGSASRSEDYYIAQFGTLGLSYKSLLYVEATARHEATSTLPPATNSYFYPSINAGFVFSDAFKMPQFINYGKLRASYGITGNHPGIYQSNVAYSQTTGQYYYGTAVSQSPNSDPFGNDNIRSEKKREMEFGIETRLFNNKVGLDISYYNNKVVDQILQLSIPSSVGAGSILTNVGDLANHGIEVAFNASPINNKGFRWDTRLNVAYNKNKLSKLAPGLSYLDASNQDGGWLIVRSFVGEALGNVYVHPIQQDDKGNNMIGGDGFYVIDKNNYKKVGNITPKVTGGFSNTVSYKNFSLDFTIDYRLGGQLVSIPHYYMYGAGMFKSTLQYRDESHGGLPYDIVNGELVQSASGKFHDGLILDGVTADGKKNVKLIDAGTYYYVNHYWESGPYEKAVFNNSYIKMREVTLSYRLPKKLSDKLKLQSLQFSLIGRNLFYIWKTIPDLDPEVAVGSSWVSQGIDGGSTAPTRSIGVSLRARF